MFVSLVAVADWLSKKHILWSFKAGKVTESASTTAKVMSEFPVPLDSHVSQRKSSSHEPKGWATSIASLKAPIIEFT